MSIISHLKLPEKLTKIVIASITKCQTKFETAYRMTEPVKLERGVKQEDLLSPILFIIYMIPNGLLKKPT
jgi:hypothetical protein